MKARRSGSRAEHRFTCSGQFGSGVDYASALARKGFALAPVLSVAIENELVAWEGHRADLIELLADLLDTGVVPADGLRDMHDAEGAVLTRLQVIQEIRHHQLSTDEFFADHGNHPLYRGSVVLGWLGY